MSDGLITRQELSQDLNEELNKTGILTDLKTSEKANLVGSVNEIFDKTTLLNDRLTDIESEVKESNSTTLSSSTGYIDILENAKGQVSDVTIKGRTVVNLLGTKGECDNVSVFNYNSNVTGVVENGRIKITITNDNTFKYQIGWINGIEVNKCYFARIDIENTNIPELRFIMSNNINQAFSVSSQQSGKFSLFLKFKFTSTNPSQYSLGLTYGATITSGYLNKQCYIDNLALFEITENEYNALSEAELAQKYPYISGTKSTLSQRVVSRGKNLFDKAKVEIGKILQSTSGNTIDNPTFFTSDFIPVKKGFYYIGEYLKPFDSWYSCEYDRNKNFIKQIKSYVEILEVQNDGYIRISGKLDYLNDGMINKGNSPIPYEPYKESVSYISLPDGEELRSLPNGVKDEIKDGKLYKRINKRILQSADFHSLITTELPDLDIVTIQKPTDSVGRGDYSPHWALLDGCKIATNANINLINIYVTKGTYPDLATAQTALIGKTLIYQLKQEEVYDLNMTPLQIFEGGSVYLEPVKVIDGEIIDANSSESTIPETTIKCPVNLAGVMQSNTDAIGRQSAILNEHESMLLTLSLQIIDLQP